MSDLSNKLADGKSLGVLAQRLDARFNEKLLLVNNIDYEALLAFDVSGTQIENELYYATIEDAVADINNNVIGENSIEDSSNAKVAVYNNDTINLKLLDDCNITSTLNLSNDLVIILNGHKIVSTDVTAINIQSNNNIINGEIEGSEIQAITSIEANNIAAINLSNGNCIINGGVISSVTNNAGLRDTPNGMIVASSNTNLYINNAKLVTKDNGVGAINALFINANSLLVVEDCHIEADCQLGLSPDAIYSSGNVQLKNCNIIGKSNHTANAAGNDYGSTSRGILTTGGSINAFNCHVIGTHSGMTVKGNTELFVNECIFESYSHGGIYISSTNEKLHLINSIIRQCDMPDGYIADSVAGTNCAGVYIGGNSNMSIYADNCKFYGTKQPIVLRGSSGEADNHLYISNSSINLDYENYGVRNDGTNQIHFGVGNNFDAGDLRYDRNHEETGEDYGKYILKEGDF